MELGERGNYWVPGAWVLAPFVDALWTPPYWQFDNGRYRWHSGYWGRYVGYYGGVNYGFGYTGRGYYGGYWNGGRFDHNRAVTNVNPGAVHEVYDRNVPGGPGNRASYNGGRGGLEARPTPAELGALREPRQPAVQAQIEHARSSGQVREQFASRNQGRPPVLAQSRPLATDYREPAPRPAFGARPQQETRPGQNAPGQENRPFQENRGAGREPQQTAPGGREIGRTGQQGQPPVETRPMQRASPFPERPGQGRPAPRGPDEKR